MQNAAAVENISKQFRSATKSPSHLAFNSVRSFINNISAQISTALVLIAFRSLNVVSAVLFTLVTPWLCVDLVICTQSCLSMREISRNTEKPCFPRSGVPDS